MRKRDPSLGLGRGSFCTVDRYPLLSSSVRVTFAATLITIAVQCEKLETAVASKKKDKRSAVLGCV